MIVNYELLLLGETRMLSSSEVNILGQVMDSTWGRSSTSKVATISLKGSVEGDRIKIVYSTYATFASNTAMSQQMPRLNSEGEKGANAYLGEVKKSFKEMSGKTLKTKLLDSSSSVEIVSLQPQVSPRRTVLFRFVSYLQIT